MTDVVGTPPIVEDFVQAVTRRRASTHYQTKDRNAAKAAGAFAIMEERARYLALSLAHLTPSELARLLSDVDELEANWKALGL